MDVPPPSMPPPPELPPGWTAKWDDNYNRFYFVNLHTKTSQWELPTAPAVSRPPTPASSPPPYEASTPTISTIKSPFTSSKPAGPADANSQYSDPRSRLAPPAVSACTRPHSGFGNKIKRFLETKTQERPKHYTPPPSNYQGVAHPQPAYKPGPQYQYPPTPVMASGRRRGRGLGMGAGAGLGMGLGGGLLGGMLLNDAIQDHDQDLYQDGFQDGADYGDGDYDSGGFDSGDFDGGGFDGGGFDF